VKSKLSRFDEALSLERVLNTLRIGLGLIWIINEMMQMEPGVFHPAYYGNLPSTVMPSVLQYIHQRAPAWISWGTTVPQWFFNKWPIETNIAIILIQLGLAASLLVKLPEKYVRLGLWGSVVWSIIVWIFLQSLGGARSWGHGLTFYSGFPGSALFYAFTSGLLLLNRSRWSVESLFKLATRVVAMIFWVSGILQLLPFNGQWNVANQMYVFANSSFQPYQPAVVKAPTVAYSIWLSSHPITNNTILAVTLICSGIAVWLWKYSRVARWYVYIWLFLSWWFGMDFGYMFSGLCTDLNIPPILFVMLFALRPMRRAGDSAESIRDRKLILLS
jgi:hypothetical protein